MARSISIAISAKDDFTSAITTMKNANQSFNKDLEGLQKRLEALNKTKATLDVDTRSAKKSLDGLKKEYEAAKKSGDGIVSDEMLRKLEEANEYYENSSRNLRLVSSNAREAEKQILNMTGAVSKAENKAGVGTKASGIINSLAAAGALKMGGDLLAGIAGTWVGSAMGSEASTTLSSVLSSIGSGAAIGTALGGPGIGTAIGVAAGVGAGLVSGATQNYQKEDDAFKSARSEMIASQKSRMASDLTAGISTAAQRQTDQIAFSKLLGGEQNAQDYLSWVKGTANTTPFLYSDLTGMSKTLATYGYSPEEMKTALLQIGDTGAALGLSTQDMSMVATGLGRMKSTGKTTLEYINLLQERGIDAIGALSGALGISNARVYDRISKGLINGADAARIIADAMGEANAGAMELQSKTFSGLTSTVEGLEQEMQSAMGEGYTQERAKGLQAQIDYLGGGNADQMEEANRLIGQWKASLENEQEELARRYEQEAYERIEREGLTGAEAGKVLMEARVQAQAEYNAGEGAQLEAQMERELVQNVTTMLADDKTYWNAGYLRGLEESRGRMAAIRETFGIEAFDASGNSTVAGFGSAYGLSYVPYDDFPARLHEGERVLTAAEARAYRAGGGVNVQVSGNSFVIREDADIDRVAAAIAERMAQAQRVS